MKFHALVSAVLLTAALLTAALSPGALAHDDATLDATRAPNGGQVRMAGAWHYELVVAPAGSKASSLPVVVYVTDHASVKTPTAGATGSVTILGGGKKATIALQPDGDNRMKGGGAYAPTPDMKAVVSIALPGQPAQQARFTPLAVAAHKAH
jgi:hypothetical protein